MQNLCAVCNRIVSYDDTDITPEESVIFINHSHYVVCVIHCDNLLIAVG